MPIVPHALWHGSIEQIPIWPTLNEAVPTRHTARSHAHRIITIVKQHLSCSIPRMHMLVRTHSKAQSTPTMALRSCPTQHCGRLESCQSQPASSPPPSISWILLASSKARAKVSLRTRRNVSTTLQKRAPTRVPQSSCLMTVKLLPRPVSIVAVQIAAVLVSTSGKASQQFALWDDLPITLQMLCTKPLHLTCDGDH